MTTTTNPRIRKLTTGTYRVTFPNHSAFTVVVPNLYLVLGFSEAELREVALKTAKEERGEDE